MSETQSFARSVQLDKEEREKLEDVVEAMRERVEDNVAFQLQQADVEEEPDDRDALGNETTELVKAIKIESVDGQTWSDSVDEYITGVGYTIVNRLAALRCMEVRDFIDEEVTVFRDDGLTPAADRLVTEEFLTEEEAVIRAYQNACDDLAAEIEILFDRSSAYSQIDPDEDTFEDLCEMIDEIPDEVWRADDVLGWIYEYYNRPVVEALDAKNKLEPEDVGPANQFYTPHWVVRMLTDNSLGKLYIEATDQTDAVPDHEALSPEERKNRLATPEDAPSVPELCTYLIPDEEPGDAPAFDHPRDLRVIDPACGSGHFLLYAFDILERIWWAETDLDRAEIPAKVLEHNLYGVDIDLRSCQLSAFNLYLKARTRTEEESGDFEMPNVGIVCADSRVAEVEEAIDVLDEITGEGTEVRAALDDIVDEFQTTEALGSLLDVHSTLSEEFMKQQTDIMEWEGEGPKTLNHFLKELREAVEDRTSDSFGEQNLKSFLNLLVVLTQEYDVALMNPPYGARGRMPSDVTNYVEEEYEYGPEYYINFFEICSRLAKQDGRVGMIVQRSFMYKRSFQNFREDFIGQLGAFDFLAEYGNGVLDKATVRTAGTVVRTGSDIGKDAEGIFYRLHDLDASEKQNGFIESAFGSVNENIKRQYQRKLKEFSRIPGSPLSYWASDDLRSVYESETVFDADNGEVERDSLGVVKQGIATADDERFTRLFWERGTGEWVPFAKGGEDAWILPKVNLTLLWNNEGTEAKRYPKSYPRNTQHYFSEALTYTYMKSSGRRFGYLHHSSIFGHAGNVFIPERDTWKALAYANTHLVTYLMLCQTPERHWEVGNVSKLPWPSEISNVEIISNKVEEIAGAILGTRQYDLTSPHYRRPALLGNLGDDWVPRSYRTHPHRQLSNDIEVPEHVESVSKENSIEELATAHRRREVYLRNRMEEVSLNIEREIQQALDLGKAERDEIFTEIALRTNQDPREREEYDPDSITEPSEDFPEMVKDLLHLTLRVVHEDDDGIVAISDVERETNLLKRIEEEFERIWGEHAQARLAEVDEVLGSKTADEEAYPNLRDWLENDLFEYHVSKFDRTPILWRLTTERLVSGPDGEGFGCLVDYHQLDENLFDRLQNRYLEPRKAELRERREAANRQRSDDSLSASEQAAAAETYDECTSGLNQIAAFEEALADLADPEPRDWPNELQTTAAEAAEDVAAFRAATADRLATLGDLAALDGVDMAELFSPSFHETVEENRDEWLDALDDLEQAFRAYAEDGSEPVAAHLYDLFEYYEDLIGTDHHSSNGILFTTYYYEQFEAPEQRTIDEGPDSDRAEYLSELAAGLNEYRELSEEIAEACDELAEALPEEWADRARSEIKTAGYRPNHKHGVAINIEPLAEVSVVPELVDDKVL
jgi:hypothetical protein